MNSDDLFSNAEQKTELEQLRQFGQELTDTFHEMIESWIVKHRHTEGPPKIEIRNPVSISNGIRERTAVCLECLCTAKLTMTQSKHGYSLTFWDSKIRFPKNE